MNRIFLFVVCALLAMNAHAQSECASSGALPRYEDARDNHVPDLDEFDAAEEELFWSFVNNLLSGVKKRFLRDAGIPPAITPILDNARNIFDMTSADQNTSIEGASGLLDNTAWSLLSDHMNVDGRPVDMDTLLTSMLQFRDMSGTTLGEHQDMINRMQARRDGCTGAISVLPPYVAEDDEGPLFEVPKNCHAVNFNLMLAPATNLSEVIFLGGGTEYPASNNITCMQSGTTPSPDPTDVIPKFGLSVMTSVSTYLTVKSAESVMAIIEQDYETSELAEPRSTGGFSEQAFGFMDIYTDSDGTKRIGANGVYRKGNAIVWVIYYSGYGLVSSVPPVSVEQDLVAGVFGALQLADSPN